MSPVSLSYLLTMQSWMAVHSFVFGEMIVVAVVALVDKELEIEMCVAVCVQ